MYYIKGNRERGAEVIKALEDKGGENIDKVDGVGENKYYFIDHNNTISWTLNEYHKDFMNKFCEEIILPEPKWIPKRGETVLVRDSDKEVWREAVFSFYTEDGLQYPYNVVGGNGYPLCIPFDIDKLGKIE